MVQHSRVQHTFRLPFQVLLQLVSATAGWLFAGPKSKLGRATVWSHSPQCRGLRVLVGTYGALHVVWLRFYEPSYILALCWRWSMGRQLSWGSELRLLFGEEQNFLQAFYFDWFHLQCSFVFPLVWPQMGHMNEQICTSWATWTVIRMRWKMRRMIGAYVWRLRTSFLLRVEVL